MLVAASGSLVNAQLEYTQTGGGARPLMLVHHDDEAREYLYGPHNRVGEFTDALMSEAEKQRWSVIGIKNDWRRVFPFEK